MKYLFVSLKPSCQSDNFEHFFFAGHITAIFHSLWDPDPALGRCLHRWVEAWNNAWPASTGPAQGVLTTGGGGTRGHADALCTEPLLRGRISPHVHDRHVCQMLSQEQIPMQPRYLQGRAAGCTPSGLSGVSLLESKPLNGNHSQIPLPAKVKHTGMCRGSWGPSHGCHWQNQGRENISWRRTGTEKVKRGLHGQKEQFNMWVWQRGFRKARGWCFGSVL